MRGPHFLLIGLHSERFRDLLPEAVQESFLRETEAALARGGNQRNAPLRPVTLHPIYSWLSVLELHKRMHRKSGETQITSKKPHNYYNSIFRFQNKTPKPITNAQTRMYIEQLFFVFKKKSNANHKNVDKNTARGTSRKPRAPEPPPTDWLPRLP